MTSIIASWRDALKRFILSLALLPPSPPLLQGLSFATGNVRLERRIIKISSSMDHQKLTPVNPRCPTPLLGKSEPAAELVVDGRSKPKGKEDNSGGGLRNSPNRPLSRPKPPGRPWRSAQSRWKRSSIPSREPKSPAWPVSRPTAQELRSCT